MIIPEIKLLSENLWESVKQQLEFFAPIQVFVRKLAEFDFADKTEYESLYLIFERIELFFQGYRKKKSTFNVTYIEPSEITENYKTFDRIRTLIANLKRLSDVELSKEIESVKPVAKSKTNGKGKVFIGHGRSKIWARVKVFLEDELGMQTSYYESESRLGESITSFLSEMLDISSFAVLILTAEDETAEGSLRARQNVVHEAGLFQGRLGFDRVVLLRQEKAEAFTNIAGLQHLQFAGDEVEQTFYELRRKFKKAGLVN
jgi:predicted nucleotide-binding protein